MLKSQKVFLTVMVVVLSALFLPNIIINLLDLNSEPVHMSPRFTADPNRTVLPCPEDVVIEGKDMCGAITARNQYIQTLYFMDNIDREKITIDGRHIAYEMDKNGVKRYWLDGQNNVGNESRREFIMDDYYVEKQSASPAYYLVIVHGKVTWKYYIRPLPNSKQLHFRAMPVESRVSCVSQKDPADCVIALEKLGIKRENENDFVITEHDYSKLYREFLNILGNN